MTRKEMFEALDSGKRVRHASWDPGWFIELKNGYLEGEISTEPTIPDKSPVLCWNNKWKSTTYICFYDAKNNAIFSYYRDVIKRNCRQFDNYQLYEGPLPPHMIELQKRLEGVE